MLNGIVRKFRQNKAKFVTGIVVYVFLLIIARLTASLSYVSQPIINILKAPFKVWDGIAPIKTTLYVPNPVWEWTYILLSAVIYYLFIYGLILFLFEYRTQFTLLCESEISKITKRLEKNPSSITDDHIIDLLKKFEEGFSKLFSVNKNRDFLCVWVYPQEIIPGATFTKEWVAFCTDKTDATKYMEIIQTGVLKETDHKHFSTDLKDYGTDAQEFAFIKNMGAFKIGVAILFMQPNKITEKSKEEFIISTALIHHLSQLDNNILTMV